MNKQDAKNKVWLVSNKAEIEEARRKGLYKRIIALPEKKKFDLCPPHIFGMIKMISEKIEELVTYWHESGEDNFSKEEYLDKLEFLLYMLEDLYPYYFNKYQTNGKLDYKKWRDTYVLYWGFTTPLSLIRSLVAFPPHVEEFYQAYDKEDMEYYARLPICGICGRKEVMQATKQYANILVHEKCAIDKGWYVCGSCNWLYPNNKHKCSRKKKCDEYDLDKVGEGPLF